MERKLAADGTGARAAVVDENEVRAAAGLTLVIGAVAFAYAYFAKQYVPLQVTASLFFAEFLIRVAAGLRYSPVGVIARAMTLGRSPELVSAKPKRFAWTLGLAMALAMTMITNSGIRGPLPRTICLICLTLMWMESALGLCLGCKIYGLLLRRGWIGADPDIEVCADGSCERPSEPTSDAATRVSASTSGMLSAAVAISALLGFASPAAAALTRVGPVVQSWSVSKIEQGVGKKLVGHDKPAAGDVFDLGPAAFNFGLAREAPDRAMGLASPEAGGHVVAQAPVLDPFTPRSAKGGAAHLDVRQTYEKDLRAGASLEIRIRAIRLETVDANGLPTPTECPDLSVAVCSPIRTVVRYHARADLVSGKPGSQPPKAPFFNVGGAVYMEGYQHHWFVGAATTSDSRAPFWEDAQFNGTGDVNRDNSGSRSLAKLTHPIILNVPLGSVNFQQRFTVHVSMDAEAIDDRGHESGASVEVLDPLHAGPGLIARDLTPGGAAKFKEPPIPPPPAAHCPSGPRPKAGTVQLSGRAFTVGEASGTPLVLVTRKGGSRGAASVAVETSGGSARSGVDFAPTRTLVRFENGDTSPRLVEIPIREDLSTERPESFTVSLADLRCGKLGKQRSASVTILDDDQPPPPPPPTFTISGTVDGLQGSGLVLSNLGDQLPVAANGSFTFPRTVSDGQSYEVDVATQPHTPDQVCTVERGAGHVASANVSDIAVHCTLLATPSGLDTTFGSGGRVSTPVGDIGQGEAVVIEPNGGIVTAGSRQIGLQSDFALTRHNPDGSLDTSFGTNGIAITDFGGADDHAYDAALTPDGGIVAVGSADPGGLVKADFAIARYNPDGTPNTNFGTGGIVMTDIRGDADQAEAVGVQADGKILVAGHAATVAGRITDFALVRYNPDGTLDQSFGNHGIVTTDFGGDDTAVALGIQADGKIVAAGTVRDDHIGLARYMPDGSLDVTFGTGGRTVDPGFGEIKGLALSPTGAIFLAGDSGGDFLLLSYRADGTRNPGFGTLGSLTTDLSGGFDAAENLTVDAQGRIILVGRATSPTILDMALARYNPDGTLDTSFANNGTLTADFHGKGEFGQDVAIDSAGRIVAAGYTANGGNTEFALMRANP
ncbi:MAG TPA: DUF4395 family protein [Solirubrobacteraceae bacterium]|nr:DUF4395 family protein [Solirubrobacteraceae bacterium]